MRLVLLAFAAIAVCSVTAENCNFRTPLADTMNISITVNEQSKNGFKVRTCDLDKCSGANGGKTRHYVDCPAHLATGTTTMLHLDNDLHFMVFVNLDDPAADEEYWFSDNPPKTITLPIKKLQTPPADMNCSYRTPNNTMNISVTVNENSTKGFKVRTCDEDHCTGSTGSKERHYVDCPADLTTGTTTLLNLDNDLHFIVFVNMDDPTGDEEYWFSDDPPQSITLPIKQLQTPPSSGHKYMNCTKRTPDDPLSLVLVNNEASKHGIKIRTCHSQKCVGADYVDCPEHVQHNNTYLLALDNDVEYMVFVNLDDVDKDEELYFTKTPPATVTLPLH